MPKPLVIEVTESDGHNTTYYSTLFTFIEENKNRITENEILSLYRELSARGEATLKVHHITYKVVLKWLP